VLKEEVLLSFKGSNHNLLLDGSFVTMTWCRR